MKIVKIKKFNQTQLIDRLKKVTMLKAPKQKPYQNAVISLEKLDTKQLYCPQRYLIQKNLTEIAELNWAMKKNNVDIFNLNGFVRFWLADQSEPRDILPIIVEESIEANGRVVNLVCDGMHRAYYAQIAHQIPQVVFIRGIDKRFPYYNYPIYQGKDWDKIDLFPDLPLPDGYVKKWTREQNYKAYYKNFNSRFKNVSVARSEVGKSKSN
ncbi:MAG: hypothetical protein GF332_00265 [Candidatus Moranbacteria bacterium]|nr:hypothetical protein [Candidatus Moranbacteria bacterium]